MGNGCEDCDEVVLGYSFRVLDPSLALRMTILTQGTKLIHGGNIVMKNEWIRAIILFIMLYAVLAFGNFGTGFQYVGF